MDSFKRHLLRMTVISLCLLAMMGCTKKNNLTGNNWSNIHSKTVDDPIGLVDAFSFPSDTLRVISGSESKLLTGNYQGNQAVAFMRFTDVPRQANINVTEDDSCYVRLMLVKRSPVSRTPLKLRLYKVNSVWNDTLSVMSNLEYLEGSELTVPDSVSIFGKEVFLKIRGEQLKTWESGADSTGFNLAVKVVDDGYVEFRASESSVGAKLNIKYKDLDDTSFQVVTKTAARDSYTLTEVQDAVSSLWKIDNAKATRMFIKWTPTNSLFTDDDGNQLSAQEIKRLTVNRATIILHAKPGHYYTGGSSFSMFPFNLKRDNISLSSPPVVADYQIVNYTPYSTGTVSGDSLEVDVTPLVQAYISGEKLPMGMAIQSTQERQNFGSIEFYDFSVSTPVEKKPYVRISYTPPYLKQ